MARRADIEVPALTPGFEAPEVGAIAQKRTRRVASVKTIEGLAPIGKVGRAAQQEAGRALMAVWHRRVMLQWCLLSAQ